MTAHPITRRAWLWMPFALHAAGQAPARRPTLAVEWIEKRIPEAFAREAVVFSRAYTCCPEREQSGWALEHGRWPHSAGDRAPSVWDFFERAPSGDADVVVMTAPSGDGQNDWRERSVHVPLAIRWRGRLAARVEGGLCSHADVLPSLLLAAGAAVPPSVQGRDVLAGRAADAVYVEGSLGKRGEWRALVRGYDKIVWSIAERSEEISGLYNVAEDPNEAQNLREVSEHRLTRDSMWALAEQWMSRLEDGRDTGGLRTRRPA